MNHLREGRVTSPRPHPRSASGAQVALAHRVAGQAPESQPELESLASGDDLRKGRILEGHDMDHAIDCKMPVVLLRHLATKKRRGGWRSN
jgi:hypothetical protein